MKIPQNKIDEIASSTDIVEVISAYTPLRKAGRNFMGRCPFHEERTPSFSVSQEKGVYHCFGCGKSGNAFTFIMDTENVTFFDAVKMLAEKANIIIEFENEPYDPDRNKTEILYSINNKAGRYFHELLNSRDGEYAKEYLNQRGINPDTAVKFGIGYSLREKDALYNEFSKEFEENDLIEAGLVLNIGSNEKRDRFRGRLMFPILNESGKVAGFGGRRIWGEGSSDDAKYINSPETRIYNKSKILYGLNFSKSSIKSEGFAVLVEGYMDLISLFQNGIENVVASSGTSLTQLHVKILSRYTKEVVVVFDSDLAGENASRRAIELFIENDMSVSVIALSSGEDPDTYIKKHGQAGFIKLINSRKSIIEYIADSYREKGMLSTPEGKTGFVKEIIGLIAKMKDEIKRDFYIKDISEKFAIYESIIRKELDSTLRLKSKGLTRSTAAQPEITTGIKAPNVKIPAVELLLIRLLIDSDSKTKDYLTGNLEFDIISNETTGKIINYIMQNINHPENITHVHLFNEFQDDLSKDIIGKALLDENYVMQGGKNKNYMNEAKSVLTQLRLNRITEKIKDIETKIKTDNQYSAENMTLLSEHSKLKTEVIRLKNELKTV